MAVEDRLLGVERDDAMEVVFGDRSPSGLVRAAAL